VSLPVYVEVDMPWYYLSFKYNPNVVEDLKFDLPVYSRGWDPERRAWRIAEDYADEAFHILRDYDYYIHQFEEPEREPSGWTNVPHDKPKSPPPALPAHTVLHVAADAPPEVIRAAYRAMAKLYHPDAGGSEAKMKEINDAWTKLS